MANEVVSLHCGFLVPVRQFYQTHWPEIDMGRSPYRPTAAVTLVWKGRGGAKTAMSPDEVVYFGSKLVKVFAPERDSAIAPIYTIAASLRHGRPKSTYCGRSRSRPWTPQLGGERPLAERWECEG